MWRALFLALGISCCLLGVEAMAIDKAVLKASDKVPAMNTFAIQNPQRVFIPPPWAPWSLISVGAVVILYSFSLPKRSGKD